MAAVPLGLYITNAKGSVFDGAGTCGDVTKITARHLLEPSQLQIPARVALRSHDVSVVLAQFFHLGF